MIIELIAKVVSCHLAWQEQKIWQKANVLYGNNLWLLPNLCLRRDKPAGGLLQLTQVIRISRTQIIEKIRCREIGYKDDLPDAIMEKLINAVLSSPKIEEATKRNIRR